MGSQHPPPNCLAKCMHVCIHRHACVCLCMSTSLHVYLCVCVYACARLCLCVHMCLHACVHVYVCTLVCVHSQALQMAECPRQGEKRTWPSWSRETAIQATGFSASEWPQHTKPPVSLRNWWEHPGLFTAHLPSKPSFQLIVALFAFLQETPAL